MGTDLSAAARIHPYTLTGPLILFFFLSHISQTLTPMQLILITESNSQCLAVCQCPGLQCGKMMAAVTSDCKDRPAVSTAGRTPSHPSFLILSSTLHLHQTLLPLACLWLMLFLPHHRQQLWEKNISVRATITGLSPLFTSMCPGLPGPRQSSAPAAWVP